MNPEPFTPSVLLFRGRGAISAIIRWQTRAIYSHAAFLLPNGRVLEAWQGSGVRTKALEDWRDIDRFDVAGMTPRQWTTAIGFARSQIGLGYDYWGVARFLSRRRMPDNHRWFCSELVFEALKQAGVKLLERIESAEVSPQHLAISPLLIPFPKTP